MGIQGTEKTPSFYQQTHAVATELLLILYYIDSKRKGLV